MPVDQFLIDLFESGRVVVPLPSGEPLKEISTVILREAEKAFRTTLSGNPPDFLPEIGAWAGQRFYRACQFLVCRDIGADVIDAELSISCPLPHSPSVEYTVDLVFRFLPDLLQMTRGLAAGDALLAPLQNWAREWPLSSVGIPGVAPVEIQEIIRHPCLKQLYIDRILRHGDTARLGITEIDEEVKATLGAFPDLNPAIAKHLGRVRLKLGECNE